MAIVKLVPFIGPVNHHFRRSSLKRVYEYFSQLPKGSLIFITASNHYMMNIELTNVTLCRAQWHLHSTAKQTINVVCIFRLKQTINPFTSHTNQCTKTTFFQLSSTARYLLPMFNEKRFYALLVKWFKELCVRSLSRYVLRRRTQTIGLSNIFIRFRKRVNKLKTNLLNKNYALHLADWINQTRLWKVFASIINSIFDKPLNIFVSVFIFYYVRVKNREENGIHFVN